ncbi:alpha-amylase family glycosyl hydrolase [Chryseobacterium hagamense]|uniref:Alpha-amylase n=1 Tax=Chryseobacterium hagamense TaxID=395935 RepID=A0A511YIR3_9FLAO|nr:alpha-amylase family glycosyl hydrolase [Chryseobacterium hagamense]GEN75088.1 alpha-amylase [Chryseobacterium hagamense]
MKKLFYLMILLCFGTAYGQSKNPRYQPKPYVEISHPEWTKNATIYEVNIRQYTPEGTFKAFEKHLPRLKKMGVDIIWLMPIHPIGELHRKGSLGSYYSVKDFKGINPDFGSLADFKNLVNKIHSMGMYVIIDWVGNHSAWDNPLAKQHPEWYTKTREGKFQPTPWYDWDDVIDFDYNNPDFREYMTGALKYWISQTNIDGYRCDVAGFIPVDFWENARAELDEIKPVFMLAEWESRDLYKRSFDMTYSWTLWDKLKQATAEKKGAPALFEYMAHDVNSFPFDSYRMTFTDNHDKNSWEGNQFSNFGAGLEAAMVLCSTVNGMPLIYSGQEAGLNRSLAFFEKDPIVWKEHQFASMYEKLFKLKHSNQALWNGKWGGEMERVTNDHMNSILSFYREKNGDAVLTVINFSDQEADATLDSEYIRNSYTELFTGGTLIISRDKTPLKLKAWDYRVFIKNK